MPPPPPNPVSPYVPYVYIKLCKQIEQGLGLLLYPVLAFIRELKLNCNEGNLRLMVVCDGVNSLCTEYTLVHREKTRFEAGPYKPWRPYRPTKDLLNKRAKVMILGVICTIYIVRTNERSLKFVIFASLCCKSVCWTFYFVMYFATI